MTLTALLTALALGVSHAPAQPVGCAYTVPVIALDHSRTMSGFMRTTDGGCIVWAAADKFLGRRALYDAQDACKAGMHEALHLAGWRHSADPASIMYSPYQRSPLPRPCRRLNARR